MLFKRVSPILLCMLVMAVLALGVAQAQEDAAPTLYATLNPAELDNDALVLLESDFSGAASTFGGLTDVVGIQSVWFDSAGTAYVTVDVTAEEGAIYVYEGLAGAEEMALPEPTRIISGGMTGLAAPKGLIVSESLGLIVVANNGGSNVLAFALDAEGDAEPTLTLTPAADFGGSVWDVAYDEATDALWVAGTTGAAFVYDGFSEAMGMEGPTRTIVPVGEDGQISINLHGIVYDGTSDTLLLSDVGAADSNSDGQLFAIADASSADGEVTPVVQIGGDESLLGNPVDIAYDGENLIVAEKANDAILIYEDFLSMEGMNNSAATTVLEITKPESLAYAGGMMGMEMGDMDDAEATPESPEATEEGSANMDEDTMMAASMTTFESLYATLNPAELANDAITALTTDMSGAIFNGFTDIANIQSVWFDSAGNAYVTVDMNADSGAVYVFDGLAGSEGMMGAAPMRMIGGQSNAGLVAPKGLIVIESLDLILVANNGPANVKGFSLMANGDVSPTVFLQPSVDFGGSVWDLYYAEDIDALFVAGTTGAVFVYDNFSANLGSGGVTRTIIPADSSGAQVSINLHGIVYDSQRDLLLLSDVGAADSNSDGQLFALPNASTADGSTRYIVRWAGDQTMLGNPVDIAFDGENLIVAEKANDAILVFENFAGRIGLRNAAANQVLSFTKPESIAYASGM
ncbi:MAG: hypothetical protein SF029_11690 [bacterium]|nr:hypothetical protein [bacterium]